MNKVFFLRGRCFPPLFFTFFFLVLSASCAGEVKKEPQKISFYELCFYLQKVPSQTTESDVLNAFDHYADHLKKSGISVLKKKMNGPSVCYFTDKVPDFSRPAGELQNGVSQYLVNACFTKENSSLHAVLPGGKSSVVMHDDIPLTAKLPLYYEINEGLSLKGGGRRLLIISRYLDILKIRHQFGLNEAGELMINIKPDQSARWMMVPFLYNSLNIEEFISPLPGDYAILRNSGTVKVVSNIKIPSWELDTIPVGRNQELLGDDAIVFSSGVLSLPFDDEMLLKYFYSLSGSYLLPPFSGLYYSPNFRGASVFPRVLLFSSELAISGETSPKPEDILLWALSVDRQIDEYPDQFYANLLSVRIAKKLYTGSPSFLGGEELLNYTAPVSFEKIRDYLFHRGNVTVFGSLKNSMYLCTDDLISEYPSVSDISRSERTKAYYGSPDTANYSVASIVVRSAKTGEITEKIGRMLIENGFSILSTLFEQVSQNDSWGSVSVAISLEDEKKLLDLYEKNFKLLDNTVSLGVYRVAKKE